MSASRVEPAQIDAAVARLRAGDVIAFPTETVYGLAADALDPAAVARLFELKGRAPDKPISVLVPDIEAAKTLVACWPARAQELAQRHWPGPLTLVLPKGPGIPDLVTAGAATVGLRCPAHPIALALIKAFDRPIAAPSANKSGTDEPRIAADVRAAFPDLLILDGGPCTLGTPSTVLRLDDVTGDQILREGALSREDLGL